MQQNVKISVPQGISASESFTTPTMEELVCVAILLDLIVVVCQDRDLRGMSKEVRIPGQGSRSS